MPSIQADDKAAPTYSSDAADSWIIPGNALNVISSSVWRIIIDKK